LVGKRLLGHLQHTWQEGLAHNKKREVWPTIKRGRQLLLEGEEDEKIEFFTQAIQRFPDDAEVRFLHASVLQTIRPEDAVSETMKAVELDPDEPNRLTRAAYLMSEVNRPDLARRYAARARGLGGSDFLFAAELSHLESRFALQDGDEESAEKGFRLSVEREPQSEMFAIDLAKFLAGRGRRQEAIEVIDEAMERAKTQDGLQRLRLEVLDQNGDSDRG